MQLDDLDRSVLTLLRQDARLSARAIARELKVAAGTVSQRIAKLEAHGIITGYTVTVDAGRIGRPLRFVVGLRIDQGSDMRDTLALLASIPEVEEVLVVTGRWDLLVLGRVGTPTELNILLTEGLWRSPSFRQSETMLVLDSTSADGAGDR